VEAQEEVDLRGESRVKVILGEAKTVHELLHLKVPNHGKVFKALLRTCLAESNGNG
jgi:hypothetical protein